MSIKVESVTTTRISMPMEEGKISSRVADFTHQEFILISVAGGGETGSFYVWTLRAWEADALETLILDLGRTLVGTSIDDAAAAPHRLRELLRLTGRVGLGGFAVAGLDACMWDLRGRLDQIPLWRMLGADEPTSVECYASGLFLSADDSDLRREAAGYRQTGYRNMKMRIGCGSLEEDVRRIRMVMEACDNDVSLAFDAVSTFSQAEAHEYAAALEEFDPLWLEDPVDYEDGMRLDELCEVSERSSIPIASGEFAHGLRPLQAMVDRHAVDVLMIDMQHVGGITPWLEACEWAAASEGIYIGPHVFPEVSVHLASALEWRLPMEYLDWTTRLFVDAARPIDGRLSPPSAPGLGVEFAWDRLQSFQVAPSRSVSLKR